MKRANDTFVLALDPGSTFGFAFGLLGKGVDAFGVWDIRSLAGAKRWKGMRYVNLVRCLNEIREQVRLDAVIYERQVHMHQNAGLARAEALIGATVTLEGWCAAQRIPIADVYPTTLKKFATGSGRADKGQMLIAAQQRWPDKRFSTSDEVDACFAWEYARARFDKVYEAYE